jgi:hypothetical protein
VGGWKDISRKTRGGRITKNTTQIQSVTNRSTRSRQAAPILAEALTPNRRPKQCSARIPNNPTQNPEPRLDTYPGLGRWVGYSPRGPLGSRLGY